MAKVMLVVAFMWLVCGVTGIAAALLEWLPTIVSNIQYLLNIIG